MRAVNYPTRARPHTLPRRLPGDPSQLIAVADRMVRWTVIGVGAVLAFVLGFAMFGIGFIVLGLLGWLIFVVLRDAKTADSAGASDMPDDNFSALKTDAFSEANPAASTFDGRSVYGAFADNFSPFDFSTYD